MRDEQSQILEPLVLLVEDELGLSKLMVMILEDEGYRVVEAANGALGLLKLKEEKPALIITDYMMPELNGYEMVCAIRKDSAFDDVPILMMSAALPQQLSVSDLVDHFLPKGTKLETLVATIHRLVEEGGAPSKPTR